MTFFFGNSNQTISRFALVNLKLRVVLGYLLINADSN